MGERQHLGRVEVLQQESVSRPKPQAACQQADQGSEDKGFFEIPLVRQAMGC